jgi:hypothetical protein
VSEQAHLDWYVDCAGNILRSPDVLPRRYYVRLPDPATTAQPVVYVYVLANCPVDWQSADFGAEVKRPLNVQRVDRVKALSGGWAWKGWA